MTVAVPTVSVALAPVATGRGALAAEPPASTHALRTTRASRARPGGGALVTGAIVVAGAGVALATAHAVLLLVVVAYASAYGWLRRPAVRRRRRRRRATRARRARRISREAHCTGSPSARATLRRLEDLVEHVTRTAPHAAAHLELEPLLEALATVASQERQMRRALVRLDRDSLALVPATLASGTPSQRRAVIEHRLALRWRCAMQLEHLQDEMVELVALIELHAERALFPGVSPGDADADVALGRSLALLEADDDLAAPPLPAPPLPAPPLPAPPLPASAER